MKQFNLIKIIAGLFVIILLNFQPLEIFAQGPPPPPNEHGTSGNKNSGNAPIGGGLLMLLGLGTAYGLRKAYVSQKETIED